MISKAFLFLAFATLLLSVQISAQGFSYSSFVGDDDDTSTVFDDDDTHSAPISELPGITGSSLTGEERRVSISSSVHYGAVNGHWSGHTIKVDDFDTTSDASQVTITFFVAFLLALLLVMA